MGDVIDLFKRSARERPQVRSADWSRPDIALVKQRFEQRRRFDAAVSLGRTRNADGKCAHCAKSFRAQQMVFHVPGFELFFCVPDGVIWRDEIYPLLKGRTR